MGVTRADLVRSGRYLAVSDEEWAKELAGRQQAIDGYMANDAWAQNIFKDVGIILTSSPYGRPYLKASVYSWKRLGYWLVLSYDNFINPAENAIDFNAWMPPKDVLDMVDTFLLPHHQTWGGVSYPYVWQLKLASRIMSGFKYVFVVNGDCVIERPEGVQEMLDLLGEADLLSSGPVTEREVGTAGLLMRSEAFVKIADHLIRHMVPFEEYEKSTQEFGNTEGRLAVAVRELGLKQVIVDPPFNEQLHIPGHGYWWKTIGFRHIHGEHNYAYRYKGVPPEPKYFDVRFMGGEMVQIIEYWKTKDMKVLEDWWAK